MATIGPDDIRAQVPWLRDKSDAEVAAVARQVFAPDMDQRQFEDKFLGKSSAMRELGLGVQRAGHALKGGLDFMAGGLASAFGDTEGADRAFQSYDANMGAANRKAMRRGVGDVRSFGDAVDFAAGVAGEALPTLLAAPMGAVGLGVASGLPAAAQGVQRAEQLMPGDTTLRKAAMVAGSTILNAGADAFIPARIAAKAATPGLKGVGVDVLTAGALGGATPLAERGMAGLLSKDGAEAAGRGGPGAIGEEMVGGAVAGAVSAGIARPVMGVAGRAGRVVQRGFDRFKRTPTGEVDLTQQVVDAQNWGQYDTPAVQRSGGEVDAEGRPNFADLTPAPRPQDEPTFADLANPWPPADGRDALSVMQDAQGVLPVRGVRRRAGPEVSNPNPIYVGQDGQVVPPAVATADPALVAQADAQTRRARLEQAPVGATLDMLGGPPRLPDAPAPEPVPPTAAPEPQPGQLPLDPKMLTTSDLLRELQAASKATGISAFRNGAPTGGKSPTGLKAVLESQDPVAAIREAFQNGANPKAELLDAWHQRLTGRKINEPEAPAESQADAELRKAWPGLKDAPIAYVRAAEAARLAERRLKGAWGWNDGASARVEAIREQVLDAAGGQAGVLRDKQGYLEKLTAAFDAAAQQHAAEEATPGTMENARRNTNARKANEAASTAAQRALEQDIAGNIARLKELGRQGRVTGEEIHSMLARVKESDDPLRAAMALEKFVAGKTVGAVLPVGRSAPPANEVLGAKFQADPDWRGRAERGMAALQQLKKRILDPDTAWNVAEDIKELRTAFKSNPDAAAYHRAVESLEKRITSYQAWEEANPKKSDPAPGFDPARFNQGPSAPVPEARQVPTQALKDLVQQVRARFPRAPDFLIAQRAVDVPGARVPADLNPSGGVIGDNVYLFREGLTSLADAELTIFHELFHLGVVDRLPDRSARSQALLQVAAKDAKVRELAERWKQSVDGLDRKGNMPAQDWHTLAAEEALSDIAEVIRGGEASGTKYKGAVKSVIDWMATLAHRMGLPRAAQRIRNMTFTEAEAFAAETVQRMKGPGPVVQPGAQRLRTERAQAKAETGDPKALAWLASSGISQDAQDTIRYHLASGTVDGLDKALNLMTTSQIVEQFGDRVRGASDLYDALQRKHGYEYGAATRAENVTKSMLALPTDSRNRLADLMFAATEAEMHPDKPLADQRDEPTPAEVKQHALLAAKFAALDKDAKKVYAEARGVLDQQFKDVVSALRGLVNRVETQPEARAERLAQIDRMIGKVRGPYFPLARFGDFVLIAKGAAADGRTIVQHFDSHAEQLRARDELVQSGVDAAKVVLTKKQDVSYQQQVSTPFVEGMRSAIHDNVSDATQRDALQAALDELVIRALPAASGAKSFLRRRNVAGYSTDAARALADSVTRAGRYVANLNHTPDLNAAITDLAVFTQGSPEKTPVYGVVHDGKVQLFGSASDRLRAFDALQASGAKDVTSFAARLDQLPETLAGAKVPEADIPAAVARATTIRDGMLAGRDDVIAPTVANHLRAKVTNITAPAGESAVLNALGTAAHIKYLGLSPAYWLTNLAQVPTVAFPHLGGRYGAANAARELGRAMRPAALAFELMTTHLSKGTGDALELGNLKGVNAEERQALQFLADRGQLDITQNSDLAHIARGQPTALRTAVEYVTSGAHYTEVFNRITVGLASYRLARGQGVPHQQAMRQSLNAIDLTQFNYAEYNKPAVMQARGPVGALARPVFMFLQYAQNTLYWWGRNVAKATKGSPEQAREARKAMGLAAVSLGVAGGAMGLPLAGTVHWLLNVALSGDDPGYDVEHELEQMLQGMGASPGTAKAILRGTPTMAGVDLSERLGQGDLLGRFGMTERASRGREMAQDPTKELMLSLMGPAVGLFTDAAKGVDLIRQGRLDKAMETVPVKGLADLTRAMNMARTGVENRAGDVLVAADELAAGDVALRAVGFTPLSMSELQQERGAIARFEDRVQDKWGQITRRLYRARMVGDEDGMQEAVAEMQKFNEALAKYPDYRMSPADMVKRVRRLIEQQHMLTITGGRAANAKAMALAQQLNPGMDPTVEFNDDGLAVER